MTNETLKQNYHPGRYWHVIDDGRIQCDLCPRDCKLHEGQRGACFVRMRQDDQIVLTTYGRSSGFCIDPIEKKPLNHFYPGSSVLSFGTAGCNLACKFCQNWDISKSRDMDRLMDQASPEAIAITAEKNGCKSVAFTYNDPVIFTEYAIDTADACHKRGIKTVAVTAGYIHAQARRDFFSKIDAVNVDLKSFSEDFYHQICGAKLQPVLDTIRLYRELGIWVEVTTLIIPGYNDGEDELQGIADFIASVGVEIPWHVTAFYPTHELRDAPRTPAKILRRARQIGIEAGLRYVYEGNIPGEGGENSYCYACGALLIERYGFALRKNRLDGGRCPDCAAAIDGLGL